MTPVTLSRGRVSVTTSRFQVAKELMEGGYLPDRKLYRKDNRNKSNKHKKKKETQR